MVEVVRKDSNDSLEATKLIESLQAAIKNKDGLEISILIHKLKLEHNLVIEVTNE